jgi:hypothetical protein
MKKVWMAVLIGIVVGAGITEGFHRVADRRSRERFEMNLRCKQLADEFVSKNSTDYTQVMLNEVHFSVTRNICVASFDEASHLPFSGTMWRYRVVDATSGEALFSDMCSDDKQSHIYCGNGRNMEIRRKRDDALKAALN